MKKLVGIVGGVVGQNPWDERCWSGSAKPFFRECHNAGFLHSAVGIEVPKLKKIQLLAENFAVKRASWRLKFNLDTSYYEELTKSAERMLFEEVGHFDFLQLGAIYNIPKIAKGLSQCFSYNDGNIACKMRSASFDKQYNDIAIEAFEWEKKVNKNLTKIFTMSEYLRKSFIDDYGIAAERVVNIGVGMNFDIPGQIIKKYEHEPRNIVFIGIDFNRKGGYVLLEAFNNIIQKHKSATLHIIGPETIHVTASSNIVFHGFLEKTDPKFAEILQQGDIAILPSLYEPFGISLLEMMAYGMPGIAPNSYAFPDMIMPNVSGLLIDDVSVEHIYNALDFYLSDPDKIKQHGIEARKYVLHKYGWKQVAENILKEIAG
ncbi:MAG: glycosyltransferase family 4 protein [Methylococcales bacterium]